MVAPVQEQTYTLDEFVALPDAGTRYELIDGRVVEMPGPSYQHGRIIKNLSRPLLNYAEQTAIGDVLTNVAYAFDPARPNHAPVPDLALVSAAQIAHIRNPGTALPFAPMLLVEVVSPTDKWFEVRERVADYLRFGTQVAWVIVPPDTEVYIYRADGTAQVLNAAMMLDGEGIAPGFSLRVADLFTMPTVAP